MTVLSRISTYAVHQNTLRNSNKIQADLFTLQQQISSGNKAENFQQLSGQVEQFTGLTEKMQKATLYQQNNSTAIARLQTMNVSLDQIINTATDIKNLMVLRRNPAFKDSAAFQQQMDGFLNALAGELNGNMEGRFLFSGSKTNVAPVITEPGIPQTAVTGTPDASYYQGSTDDVTARAQDNYELNYNIRADNPAFQNLFAAVFQGMKADTTNDDADMVKCLDLVQKGLDGAIALQSGVNSNIVHLTQINDRHSALQLYWKGVTEAVSKTDMVSASTQVAVDQSVLQASFQSFARITQLKLSDYL